MVEQMEQKYLVGIIGVISMLVGAGGTMLFSGEDLNNVYVCPLTDQVGVFERLSGSAKTGYYTINGSEQSAACRIGRTYAAWIQLQDYEYAQQISGSDAQIFALETKTGVSQPKKELCGFLGCVTIPKI